MICQCWKVQSKVKNYSKKKKEKCDQEHDSDVSLDLKQTPNAVLQWEFRQHQEATTPSNEG